jgi:NAD(P)-dependent dehydrogenase (short-subunit alcohol dehydrogenase family)
MTGFLYSRVHGARGIGGAAALSAASASRVGVVVLGDQHVDRRHDEEREQRADGNAAGDDEGPCRSATPRPPPEATMSGVTPSTIAAVVIRIGLSRMPQAASIASRFDLP